MTALFIAALFLWEAAAWAAPASLPEVLSAVRNAQRDGIEMPVQFQIPPSLGSIQETFSGLESRIPSPVLVHIEDAHGEPEAQKNSQAILEHLKTEYGIQTFFLEGAWSKLEPSLLSFSDETEENQRILSEFTEKGIVGGPENFLWENSQRSEKAQGYGIEDLELYKKNLEQFRAVMSAKPQSDIFLNEMKAGLLTKASQILNSELAEYFRQWSFHEEVESDYSAHLRVLAQKAHAHLGLDLSDAREQYDWPMLVRFSKLKELEKAQESGAINHEVDKFKKWANGKLESKDISIAASLALSGSGTLAHDSARDFFEQFYARASLVGFKFKDYPALSKVWGQQMLAQEMHAPSLIQEIKTLENKLIEKLAQTADEKKFIEKYREYLLLKKLLHLELSKEEFRVVQRISHKLIYGETLKTALAFYETAEARDTMMVERTIDWIKKEKIEKAAIITGGFHSRGLGELFKQKNISYVRIQPRITHIYGRENYLKWALSEKSSLRTISPAEPAAPAVFRNALAAEVAAIVPEIAVTSSRRSEARTDENKERAYFRRDNFELIRQGDMARLVKAAEQSNRIKIRLVGMRGRVLFDELEYLLLDRVTAEKLSAAPLGRKWRRAYLQNEETGEIFPTSFSMLESGNWTYRDFSRSESRVFGIRFDDPRHAGLVNLGFFAGALDGVISFIVRPFLRAYLPEWYPTLFNWLPDFLVPFAIGLVYSTQAHLFKPEAIRQVNFISRIFKAIEMKPILWLLEKLKAEGVERDKRIALYQPLYIVGLLAFAEIFFPFANKYLGYESPFPKAYQFGMTFDYMYLLFNVFASIALFFLNRVGTLRETAQMVAEDMRTVFSSVELKREEQNQRSESRGFVPQPVPEWFRHLIQKSPQTRERVRFVIHEGSGVFYSAHALPGVRKDLGGVEWLTLETYSQEWPLKWVDWKATEELTRASTQVHGKNYPLPFSPRSEMRRFDSPLQVSREEFNKMWLEQNATSAESLAPYGAREWHKEDLLTGTELKLESGDLRVLYHKKVFQSSVYQIWFLAEGSDDWQRIDQEVIGLSTAEDAGFGFSIILNNDSLFVSRLFLWEPFRGRHFGRLILEWLKDYASHRKVKRINFETRIPTVLHLAGEAFNWEKNGENVSFYSDTIGRIDARDYLAHLGAGTSIIGLVMDLSDWRSGKVEVQNVGNVQLDDHKEAIFKTESGIEYKIKIENGWSMRLWLKEGNDWKEQSFRYPEPVNVVIALAERSEMRQTEPPHFKNLVGNGRGLGFLPFLRAWEFFYHIFKAWTLFRKKPWPIQIEGYENLWLNNPDERLILAGNHTGLAENLFFVTELYRLAGRMPFFIAQPEHVDAFTRQLIRMGGGLPIEKGKTVGKAKEFLRDNPGAILGVFPAGRPERVHERIKTAAVSGKGDDEIARDFLHWNESAAAKIAVETGAAVVPFAIDSNVPRKWGVKELWRAFRLWQKNDPRQPPFYIRVRIGKPISSKGQTLEALMSSVKLAVVGELRKATEEAKFNPSLWLDGYLRKFPEVLAAQPASKKWSDFKVVEFFHAQMLKNFSHEPNWAVRFVDTTSLKSLWFQKLSPEQQKLIRLYRTYLKLHHDDLNYFESLFNAAVSRRHFMSLLSGVFVTATASGLTQMPLVASQQAVPASFYRGLGGMARTIAAEQSRAIGFGQSTVFEWATEHLGLNDAFERWGKQNSSLMEQLWSMVRKEEKRIAENDVLVQARVYEILSSVLSGQDLGRSNAVMELPAYERLRGRIFESAESLLERLNHGVEIFKSFSPQARRGIMLQLGKSPSVGPGVNAAEAQRQRINKTKKELQQKLQKKQAHFYSLIDSVARYVFESANPDAAVRIKLEKAIADYEAEIIKLKKQIDGEIRDLADQEASLEVSQKILAQIQPYLHAYRERTIFNSRSEMRGGLTRRAWLTMAAGFIGASAVVKAQTPVSAVKTQLFNPAEVNDETLELKKFIGSEIDALLSEWTVSEDKEQQKRAQFINSILPTIHKKLWFYSPKNSGSISTSGAVRLRFGSNRLHEVDPETGKPAFELMFSYDFANAIRELILSGGDDAKDFSRRALLGGIFMKEMMTLKPMIEHPEYFEILAAAQTRFNNPISAKLQEDGRIEIISEKISKEEKDFLITTIAYFDLLLEAEGYVGELDYLTALYPPEKFISAQKKMMQFLQNPNKAGSAWSLHFKEKGAEAIFGFLRSRTNRFIEDKKFTEKWNTVVHSQKIKWEALRHILAVQQGKGASLGVTVTQWLVYDALMRRQMDVAWDKKMDFLGNKPEELGLPKSVEDLNQKIQSFRGRSEVREQPKNPYLAASFQMLEEGDRKMGLSAEQTKRFKNPRNIFIKRHEVKLGGETKSFVVSRVRHFHPQDENKKDLPVRGGLRVLMPSMLGKDFDQKLSELPFTGDDLYDLYLRNQFLERWIQEYAHAMAIQMTLKNLLWGLPRGGAKGVIFLGEWKKMDGEWKLVPTIEKRDDLNSIARLFREVSKIFLVNNVIHESVDGAAPDVNPFTGIVETDRIMEWMVDSTIRVLAQSDKVEVLDVETGKVNKSASSELQLLLESIAELDITQTPYLETVILFLRKNAGLAWPVLGRYTGKSVLRAGSQYRTESTGEAAVVIAREMLRHAVKIADDKNLLRGKTAAVQGFGAVGIQSVLRLIREGAHVMLLSDHGGAIRSKSKSGFTFEEVTEMVDLVRRKQSIIQFAALHPENADALQKEAAGEDSVKLRDLGNAELLQSEVDLLFLAALNGQIHPKNADLIRARYVVDIANGGVTPDAAAQLAQKNILVAPSILASGGGTAISHQEVLQNESNHYFEMNFVRENLESDIRDFMRAIYQVIETERVQGRKLDLNEAAYVVARQKTLKPLTAQTARSEIRVFNGYDGVADEVVKVAREKQARKKGTGVLLGLGGPSGVGKGFFSKIISGALTQQGYDVHSLEIDGFLKLDAEDVKLQQRAAAQGKIHDTEWDFWDEEEAFDVLWMVHDFLNMSFDAPTHPLLLDKIKAAGNPDNIDVIEIVIPQAWHRTQKDGSNRYEDKWVLHRDSVVILDGKYIARFEKKFREVKSKRLSDALLVLEDDGDATREKYVHRVYEKYAHQLRSASYLLDEKLNIFDNALVPSYQRYENETRDVWDYLINVRGLYRPEISEDYPQPIVFESQDVINPKKLDESVAADLRIFSDFVLGYYPEHYQRVKKALNEKRLLAMVGYEKLPTAAQVMGEILAELHMAMRDHSANPRKLQTLFQFNTPTAINFPDLKAAMSVYLEGRAMPVRELERILDNKDDEQRGKMDRNLTYQLLIAPKLMQYLMYLAQSTKELKTFAHYRDRAVNAWSNLEREALAALKADGFEMSGDFVGLAYKEKLIQNAMNIILGNYSSVQYQDGESAARSEMRMPKAGRDSFAALRFFYREVLRLHLDMTRASYRSTEEDEQKQAVYDEVAVDLKELQRLLQGHPQLRRQLASRIKSAVNMLAERGTKRNPVAAGTALTQAVEDILNKLYEPRVKKQGRRHRDSLASRKIVNLKNGMWILKQGVYRNVKVGKRGSVAMTQKQDKQFSSLWELARSLDHQLEKMTSELTRARETLVVLNDIQDFLEHSAGELPPDLSARLGKTLKTMQAQWVIEKQLAAQALQFAVELEHQEVRSRVARFAEYASWLIKMRADELESMIASVQRLREKDLKNEVISRNYNFARSLRSLKVTLERYFGTTGVTWSSAREPRSVQAKMAGIIRDLEQVREPDFEGILALMRGIQSGFGQSLKAASPETEPRLLRYVDAALGLVEFSDVRHHALFEFEKRKREIGSKSEEMDEDTIFQTVFQDLINQRKLNDRTQWPSAWFDLYAFAREPIHLTVQKERVPNPRFEALRVLSQILGAKSLQDALNRKKVKAVEGLAAKIKELGGSDLNQSVLNLPGEARKQLFEFIQTTFQLEKKLPLLPAQYRARSEVRRPDPWEATGLWKAVDLKQKIQEAKQPGQYVNQYRLSASLKALSESEWKDLEEWAGQEDSIDLAALNRMKQNDAKYSPVLELGEDLIEQRREMPLFFGMARMIRQSWTDKNEELWMKVLKIGSKHQFKAHGTLNNAIKEHGSLVANLGVLQLHAAMLGIMIDGKISRGDLGEFGFSQYDDFAPLNAADYGPYYVLMHPDYRKADFEYRGGWHDTNEEVVSRNDHLIYLIPEEGARPYFIQGLKKSVEYGFMSEQDAKTAEDKIMTYEEFIAADEKMKEILSKEKTPAEVIHLAMRSETRMKAQDELAQRRSTAPLLQPKKSGNAIKIETGSAVDSLRSEVRYFEGTKHRQFISKNGFARAYSVPAERLAEALRAAAEKLPSQGLFEELLWIGKRKPDLSWDLAVGVRRDSGQDYPSHTSLAKGAFGLKREDVASGVLKFRMNRQEIQEAQFLPSASVPNSIKQREELVWGFSAILQFQPDQADLIRIRDESVHHALFDKRTLLKLQKQDKAGKYYLLAHLLRELNNQEATDTSRSETRANKLHSAANELRAAVAEANQNIFAVEFVASMSRAEFRSFFDRAFPRLVIDRQKRLRDSALSKAGVTLSINEGLIVGADLAETEGFWEAAKILFSGQKIAILGDGQSPLDNVRFFNDIPSAKQWVNAKKIVAWVSPEEALEHAELRKEVFDWVIMNEQRLAKLYSALGLEAFAQKLMISREFLRAA